MIQLKIFLTLVIVLLVTPAFSGYEQCTIVSNRDSCFRGVEISCPSIKRKIFLPSRSMVWHGKESLQIGVLCKREANSFWIDSARTKFYLSIDQILSYKNIYKAEFCCNKINS